MAAVPDLDASLGHQVPGARGIARERGEVDRRVANSRAQPGHGVWLVGNVRVPVEDAQLVSGLQRADHVIAVGRNARDFFLHVPDEPVVAERASRIRPVATRCR